MDIESVRHKALKVFIETGKAKGIDARLTGRIRNMVAFLSTVAGEDELWVLPNFGFHILTGDRAGICAMTLTRNWRLTFGISDDNTIIDMDLEDYH